MERTFEQPKNTRSMKKLLPVLIIVLAVGTLLGQEVTKRIVVEHFTNTRCPICGSRNPALIQNLENNPDVLHLSIHPRSPYPDCVLYQHNTTENSDRTTYYNIPGTPNIVIQGQRTTTSFGSATLFDQYQDQMTPVSIDIYQVKTNDEISVDVVVKAVADNEIGQANLFLAAAEKLLNYNAPNGETEHHDVFRRTFTGQSVNGLTLNIPAVAGDSLVLSYTLAADEDWVFEQIYAIAILNATTDKSVIQAAASSPEDNNPLVSTREVNTIAAQIFPNPVADDLSIRIPSTAPATARIFNAQGQLLQQQSFVQQTALDLRTLPQGIYWLEVRTSAGKAIEKIIKR